MKLFTPSGSMLLSMIASAEAKFDAQRAELLNDDFDEVAADMDAQRKGEGLEWWEVQDAERMLAENELTLQAQAASEDC